jgi:hypothetical protein
MTWYEDGFFLFWVLLRLPLLLLVLAIAEATLLKSGSERVDKLVKMYVMLSYSLAPAMFYIPIGLWIILVICVFVWKGLCFSARVFKEALPVQWYPYPGERQ